MKFPYFPHIIMQKGMPFCSINHEKSKLSKYYTAESFSVPKKNSVYCGKSKYPFFQVSAAWGLLTEWPSDPGLFQLVELHSQAFHDQFLPAVFPPSGHPRGSKTVASSLGPWKRWDWASVASAGDACGTWMPGPLERWPSAPILPWSPMSWAGSFT
jgi:hypothetical protein